MDEKGEFVEGVRVANADIDELAQKYKGSEAALETGSDQFTIYDELMQHLDVPRRQKIDRRDAKNFVRYLRLNYVPKSYVSPEEYCFYRGLARGRKKSVDKRNDFKKEVNSLLDQNEIRYDGSL